MNVFMAGDTIDLRPSTMMISISFVR